MIKKIVCFCMTLMLFCSSLTYSQATIELLGAAGAGGPSGSGPVTTSQSVTFYTSSATAYSPATTATYTLSNQQFATVEGNPGMPGALFGSATSPTTNVNTVASTLLYPLMNAISGSASTDYTACNSCAAGTGINVAQDHSVEVMLVADALINSVSSSAFALNARVQFADLTITFNRPVSNPVLHLTGMGARVDYVTNDNIRYYQGFSTEFQLLSAGLSFSKLSGNSVFTVTPTNVSNAAAKYDAPTTATSSGTDGVTRQAASGSVAVLGTNITTISLRLFLKGDGGYIGSDNTGAAAIATAGNTVRWALGGSFTPNSPTATPESPAISAAGDQVLVGISLQQPVNVSGTVFNDPNGGNVNNSTGSSNTVPSGMFANLTDASGRVVASVPVNTDGTYSFTAIGEGNYTVNISTASGVQASFVPAAGLPAGWSNTGEFNGAPNTGTDGTINGTSATFTVATTDVTNVNMGINQAPQSAVSTVPGQTNPGGTTNVTVPAVKFLTSDNPGTNPNTQDFSGGSVTSLVITAFPTNATSITINGITYTSATFPAGGVTVPAPGGVPSVPIAVDPVNGIVNVVIPFVSVDNLGVKDPTPGSVTLNFTAVLPVRLTSFTGSVKNCNAAFTWTSAEELNFSRYELEYSTNGFQFITAATLSGKGNNSTYTVAHHPLEGKAYYRLKMIDVDGKFDYSNVLLLVNNCSNAEISVYPNPAVNNVTVSGAGEKNWISLYDAAGKLLLQQQATGSGRDKVNVSAFAKGIYIIRVTTDDGTVIANHRITRQ